MANDMQWPSEDEDFDAVIDKKTAKTAKTISTATAAPPRKSVSVVAAEDEVPSPAEESITPEVEDTPEVEETSTPETVEEEETSAPTETVPPEMVTEITPAAETPASTPTLPTIEKQPQATISGGDKSPMGRLFLEVMLVMVLAAVGIWAIMLSSDNKDLKSKNTSLKNQVAQLNANPQIAVQKQTDDLLQKVGALMQLPTGETPTVANVSDAAAAKKQSAFFNNAQNGDRVLMYVKAGQAILYRPSTNKIILVAPLTFTGTSSPAATAPATTKKP